MICIIGVGSIIWSLKEGYYSEILVISIIFSVTVMIFWTINTGDLSTAVAGAYAPFLLILIIPVMTYGINYKALFLNLLMAETVVTIGIVCLDMVGIINVNEVNEIRNFIYEWEIGFSGKSSVYSAYYKEFSKTSPLLLLDDAWKTKKWGKVAVALLALLFLGNRANIFVALDGKGRLVL